MHTESPTDRSTRPRSAIQPAHRHSRAAHAFALAAIILLTAVAAPAQAKGKGGGNGSAAEDILAPVITPLFPEEGLVTADDLTAFRFEVIDPAPGTQQGKSGRRSLIDPASLTVTVNGVDRTADALLFKNDQTDPYTQGAFPQGVADYHPSVGAPLPQGEVEVVVSIADLAGNVGTATRHIFVDAYGPDITALTPPAGGTVSGGLQPLTWAVTDAGVGVDSTSTHITIGGSDRSGEAHYSDGQLTLTPAEPWPEGPLAVTVQAADTLGNSTYRAFDYTVVTGTLAATPRAVPERGDAPLTVRFIPEFETDSAIERFDWDFDGDGVYDRGETIGRDQTYTYRSPGTYSARLRVTDSRGRQSVGIAVVEVTNAPPTVTAHASPQNGPVPLTVQFTAGATDNEGIAHYEWDFDGDGNWDATTPTGSTSHTYTDPGTYPAAVKVTDTYGAAAEWRAPVLTIQTGEPGSPSVTASASPTQGKAPLTVQLTATGSGDITAYDWDLDGDGQYDTSGQSLTHTYERVGTFYPTVRATAADGATVTASVRLQVEPSVSLSVGTDTLDPLAGGAVTIDTQLGGTTEVSLVIEDRARQVVRTLVPWGERPGGSHRDSWSGYDDQGNLLPEGDYYTVLLYRIDGTEHRLDHRATSGGSQFTPTRSRFPSTFAPFAGDPLDITFTLNRAAEVTAFIGRYNVNTRLVTLLERKPLGRGTHHLTWTATDSDGRFMQPPSGDRFLFGLFGFTLADNGIYLKSGAHLTGLAVAPSIFNPGNPDEVSQLRFHLDKAADIELVVADADSGKRVTKRSVPGLPPGEGLITWDGTADDGTPVAPGRYRLGVTAIDAAGSRSITHYALQRVYY